MNLIYSSMTKSLGMNLFCVNKVKGQTFSRSFIESPNKQSIGIESIRLVLLAPEHSL